MIELTASEFNALSKNYDLIPLSDIPDLLPQHYPNRCRMDKKGNVWFMERFKGINYGYINAPTKMLRKCMGSDVKIMMPR